MDKTKLAVPNKLEVVVGDYKVKVIANLFEQGIIFGLKIKKFKEYERRSFSNPFKKVKKKKIEFSYTSHTLHLPNAEYPSKKIVGLVCNDILNDILNKNRTLYSEMLHSELLTDLIDNALESYRHILSLRKEVGYQTVK